MPKVQIPQVTVRVRGGSVQDARRAALQLSRSVARAVATPDAPAPSPGASLADRIAAPIARRVHRALRGER
jgi:hypothetical protein